MGSLKEKVQKNWRKVIVFSIIIFAIILAQDIIREIVLFNNELTELENSLDTQMRNELENEVLFRIHELDEIYESLDTQFEDDLESEIFTVEIAAEALIPHLGGSSSLIEDELISLVSDDRVHSAIYSYILLNIDGTVVYDQDGDYLAGESVLDVKDTSNRAYFDELITLINADENMHGGVSSYFHDGTEYSQVTYHGFRLEGTDYIIVIHSSLSDYLEFRILEYASSLETYYMQKDRSIVLLNRDGYVYLHRDASVVGTNVLDGSDSVIKEAVQGVIDFAEEHDNGFLDVEYYENYIDGDVIVKTAYINVHEYTDLIVGYSNDSNSYRSLIVEFQNENMRSVLTTLIPVYIAIIVIVVYVSRLILLNNKLSVDVLNEEEQLYKVFSDITQDIILITDKKGNIIFTNKLGHRTIFPTDEFTLLNLDDILVDEEAYKVLIGIEKNHYVKSSVSQIVYDGVECDLYILKDVTEKVTNERKLEAMTLADDLTGLGNRRLLLRDYKDYVLPHIKDGNLAYLAMIDLDNFKEANDKYGHTFGDDVLINISEIFKSFTSNDVKIYRVGGDEFALIALNVSKNDCLKLLRKIKNKVSTFNYGKKVRIGFSAGLTEVNISDSKRRLSDYYERADELLYIAKEEGKDRIKV